MKKTTIVLSAATLACLGASAVVSSSAGTYQPTGTSSDTLFNYEGEVIITPSDSSSTTPSDSSLVIIPGSDAWQDNTDCTQLLTNPSFSDYYGEGWTWWQSDNYMSFNKSGGDTDAPCAEAYSGGYNNAGFMFDVYQTIEGLPDGVYSMSVDCFYRNGAYSGAALNNDVPAVIYMNDVQAPVCNILSPTSGSTADFADANGWATAQYYDTVVPNDMKAASTAFAAGMYKQTVYAIVQGGSLRLGIKKSNDTSVPSSWCAWSNFRLVYEGKNEKALDIVINNTQETLNSFNPDHITTLMQEHLASAESALKAASSTDDVDEKRNLAKEANALMNELRTISSYVKSYDYAMEELNSILESVTPAAEVLAEINEIESISIDDMDQEQLYELNLRIMRVTELARIPDTSGASDDSPVDMTSAITNPSFEQGGLGGWNYYSGDDTKAADNTNETYHMENADGNYVFNTWSSYAPEDGFYLSQVVKHLPAGTYRLSAIAASDQGNEIHLSAKATTEDATLYADTLTMANDKQYGQNISTLFVVNEGEDIEIKMHSYTWFKADNFRLTCYGASSKKDPATGGDDSDDIVVPEGYSLLDSYAAWASDNKGQSSSTSTQTWKIDTAGDNDIIKFTYEVSSEEGCDWLTIDITDPDGATVQLAHVSGSANREIEYKLEKPGQYTLTATYTKDESVDTGNDLGRVSAIRHFAGDVAKTANEYLATIETSYPGLAAELSAAIDEAASADEESKKEANLKLSSTLTQVRNAVSTHVLMAELISEANTLKETLTTDYPEFNAAIAAAEALDVATAGSQDYAPLYDALRIQYSMISASILPMDQWAFNTSKEYTVDGLKYYVDSTNKIAQFNGIDSYNKVTKLAIPEVITVDGADYAVVSMENRYTNRQDSINEVTLPKTLRRIGQNAFSYYRNLRELDIPASVSVIGQSAFSSADNLRKITLHSATPATCEGALYGNSKKKIIVPDGSFHAYRLASQWGNCIIQTETPTEVNVTVGTPGELGRLAIDQAGYLQEINRLTVAGELNSDDWTTIKNMTNLLSVDMEGVLNTSIPNEQFRNKWAIDYIALPKNTVSVGNYAFYGIESLASVKMPNTLETINQYAFCGTKALRSISLPESLKSIEDAAFENSGLDEVTIPSGVTVINNYTFRNCTNLTNLQLHDAITTIREYAFSDDSKLKDIKLPESLNRISNSAFRNTAIDTLVCPATLRSIGDYAFGECSSLVDIQLNEGLQTLESSAFGNCQGLTEVTLPSSLRTCTQPFYNCSNLKKLYARSVIPATTNGYSPINNVALNDVVLYVPVFSLQDYQLAEGWSSFYTFEVYDYLPENIVINKSYTFSLREDLPDDYRPNIDLSWSDHQINDAYGNNVYETGSLTINNMSKLAVNDFSMYMSPYVKDYKDGYYWNSNGKKYSNTPLIVNGEMRAENVAINLMVRRSQWQFISFPFDVLMKDIKPVDEVTQWVVREYSGDNRANNKLDETWVNVPADGTLKAGKGYILHCYKPNADDDLIQFTVSPLKESVNRQAIFLATDRKVALEENLSEFEHNRSWNLIGNPYPSYYDTRFLDFEAPVTVWNSNSSNYQAYSPVDDEYILSPGEAFFVQRPVDQESIIFDKAGRQTDTHARIIKEADAEAKAARKSSAARANRHIINISLTGEDMSDRTRVVINEAASMSYELNRDASKFMSDDANASQIFSINGGVRYAINERPADNNEITLGVRMGKEGSYSISLPESCTDEFVIEDKLTGAKATLNAESPFTFIAEPGDEEARFVLYLKPEGTTGIGGIGAETADQDGKPAFNVAGQAVNEKTAEGIIIKNNRKVIKK